MAHLPLSLLNRLNKSPLFSSFAYCISKGSPYQIIVFLPPQPKRKFVTCLDVWKLRDPDNQTYFAEVFKTNTQEAPIEEADIVVEQPG